VDEYGEDSLTKKIYMNHKFNHETELWEPLM